MIGWCAKAVYWIFTVLFICAQIMNLNKLTIESVTRICVNILSNHASRKPSVKDRSTHHVCAHTMVD